MTGNKHNTIVVGAGIAGLTSAAYLARAGKNVLLIEKNKECGGLVNTFSSNGFRFEAGVRALLDAGIIFPMLKELNIQLDVVKSDVSVGIGERIMNVRDKSSLDEYRNLLTDSYPENTAEIDELLKVIRKIMKEMDVLYGIENPNFKDLFRDYSFLFNTLLPWFPKFLFTLRKIYRLNMPVEDYLENIITNPSLRDIISQHFFKNTPTFFALSYFSLYLDYFYPKGGVGMLAKAVEEKYLELGGAIVREKNIVKVDAFKHVLYDNDNNKYSYKNLIWAADLKTFYRITEIKGYSQKISSNFEKEKDKMLKQRGGDSVFTLYLEIDEPAETFKNISHGHFFYTPSKEGLGNTHWSALDHILENVSESNKAKVFSWVNKYITLNTFEISIPVLKDPAMAPEGKTGMIVSVLAEYDLFNKIDEAGWYREFVSYLENKIIEVLSSSIYPMLRDKTSKQFSFSPVSYKRRVEASEGAVTGWSFQNPVPVENKMLGANRAVLTPLPSVFQAGQWTYSPGGVPMSILTGKLAASRVLKR